MFAGMATDASWVNVAHVKSTGKVLDYKLPEQVQHHMHNVIKQVLLFTPRVSVVASLQNSMERPLLTKLACALMLTLPHSCT